MLVSTISMPIFEPYKPSNENVMEIPVTSSDQTRVFKQQC